MKLRNGKTISFSNHKIHNPMIHNPNENAIQIQKTIRQFLCKIKYNSIQQSIHILQKYIPHFIQRPQHPQPLQIQPQLLSKQIQIHCKDCDSSSCGCSSDEYEEGGSSSDVEDDDNFIIDQYGKCRNKGKGIQNGVVRSKRRNKGLLTSMRYQDPDYQKIFFDKTETTFLSEFDDSDDFSIETEEEEKENNHCEYSDHNLGNFIVDDSIDDLSQSMSSDEFIDH